MVKGQFGGWFVIEDQPRRVPVATIAATVAVALLSWLATELWLVAAALGTLLAAGTAAVIGMRHWSRRAEGEFTARMQILHGGRAAQLTSRQTPAVTNVYHGGTHLHLEAGTPPETIRRALEAGAVTEGESS